MSASVLIPLLSVVIGVYASVLIYLFRRLRKYSRLPTEQRRRMTYAQRILYLYGLYQVRSKDLPSVADGALSTFRDSWQEMDNIFHQLESTFERRRKELQEAEQSLSELQQKVQEQDERLQKLSQLTPEAAQEVSEAIRRTGRASLRQQIIISVVFFVLGIVTTIAVTLAIR